MTQYEIDIARHGGDPTGPLLRRIEHLDTQIAWLMEKLYPSPWPGSITVTHAETYPAAGLVAGPDA